MTVHMVRLYSEPPKNENHFTRMYQACEDWTTRYNETLQTQRLDLRHITASDDRPEPAHTVGHWRFVMDTDANTLLADLEADLQSEVSWYRLKYHECSHDEAATGGCSWDDAQTREFGTVPAGIP